MVDGNYKIYVDTPLGKKPGSVRLRTQGDVVFADLDVPIIGKQSAEGKLDGDTFTVEGTYKLRLLGKVNYSLCGEVSGDDLHIYITSSKGNIELSGVRV